MKTQNAVIISVALTALSIFLICSVSLNLAQFYNIFDGALPYDQCAAYKAAMNLGDKE